MKCKFCNTENPEQAVFCKTCGKRLDGTVLCPSCGGQISAEDAFCIFCGAENITQTVKKPAPAHKRDCTPAFVAEESAVAAEADEAYYAPAVTVSERSAQTTKKVLNYVANAAAILTSVLALIFVFFIGSNLIVNTWNGNATETFKFNLDINYFLNDGYEQIKKSIAGIKEYNDSLSGSLINYNTYTLSNYQAYVLYIPLVFGTLILVGTIIAVLSATILAVVRSAQNLTGKSQKSGCTCAVAAFMSYVLGSALINAIYQFSFQDGYDSVVCTFNSTTETGIILLAIFTFITIVCKTATKGRRLLDKGEVLKYSFGLGGIALLAVVLGLASTFFIGMEAEGETSKCGINLILVSLSRIISTQSRYELVRNVEAITALAPCVFILTCTCAIIAAVCIKRRACNIQDDSENSSLTLNLVLVCLTVLQLILTIVFLSEYKKGVAYIEDSEEFSFQYAVPIVMLVFSVLALIENIVYRAMKKSVDEKAYTQFEIEE